MDPWNDIAQAIGEATGKPFSIASKSPIGGGCINRAYRLSGDGREFFVKVNRAFGLEMFQAEAEALGELAAAAAMRVPLPVTVGVAGPSAYLVLEYIPLVGRVDGAALGTELAALHRVTGTRFGWHRDNTIGSTPQVNTPENDWVAFWQQHRLGVQLDLAGRSGLGPRALEKGARLMEGLAGFFTDHRPQPSLLHGDLWGGNAASDDHGRPVIFDPATYYGDRETDLAMTELFGGFGGAFLRAYQDAWPLDAGYRTRKTLYNLYHILNHFNLFGGGYGAQADAMIDRLLAELR